MIFKYIYNDGVTIKLESLQLSYFENLINFVINLDYEVYILKKNLFFYFIMFYNNYNFYFGCLHYFRMI